MVILIFTSALYGAVQGLTEFFPISSSGHLLLLHDIFRVIDVDSLTFDASLHIGTLLALLVFFRKEIVAYSIAFFSSIAKRKLVSFESKIAWLILIGCIPAAIAGFFAEDIIVSLFRHPAVIAATLVIGGVLFLFIERYGNKSRKLDTLTLTDTIIIGIAQILSLIPGISRSGITIVAGMGRHFSREEAARFSFLLSIPIVFGAGIKKILDAVQEHITTNQAVSMFVGICVAAAVGIFAIRFLLAFTRRKSLALFAWYRFGLAAVVIAVLLVQAAR